jgi:hypothetical protein
MLMLNEKIDIKPNKCIQCDFEPKQTHPLRQTSTRLVFRREEMVLLFLLFLLLFVLVRLAAAR